MSLEIDILRDQVVEVLLAEDDEVIQTLVLDGLVTLQPSATAEGIGGSCPVAA